MSEPRPASLRPQDADAETAEVVTRNRVLCADGVVHYRFGQDVSTFRDMETALAWAEEFSSKPGVGQFCGPHTIGVPHV